MIMRHLTIAAALMLSLSACGGGGGGTKSIVDTEMVRALTGAEPPAESAIEQNARAPSIISRADSLIVSTFYGETNTEELPNFILLASCEDTQCDISSPSLGPIETVGLSDLGFSGSAQEVALGTKHGVTAFSFSDSDGIGLGAWMHHSTFEVSEGYGTYEDIEITLRAGVAAGDLTETQPTGNATWSGIMIGMTASGAGRGERLQGDANLIYDLAASGLDISFSGIQNLDRGRAHSISSVQFDDVPVTLGGTFEAGFTGNRVQGGFYGPEHAEAAGVFEQSNVVGAFGATR